MTFYLIGLGLKKNSISCDAKKVLGKCDKVYVEGYTVDFPYSFEELKEGIGCNFEVLEREPVEDEHLLVESKNKNIALLVYGDSLSATTHTQLILECKKRGIDYQIFHNASILIAIAETGLQLYKFGKIPSMPKWQKSFEPTSFLDYYLENKKVGAHTLLLVDIGLDLDGALDQLERACNDKGCEIEKLAIISNAGLENQKIYYDSIEKLRNLNIVKPYCFIIPGEMHFVEAEALEEFSENLNL